MKLDIYQLKDLIKIKEVSLIIDVSGYSIYEIKDIIKLSIDNKCKLHLKNFNNTITIYNIKDILNITKGYDNIVIDLV
ncbi:hypothetical protein [Brachyspira pilosicoli]|uniref:hypothetical protein n=1 Tax=Brachyspira pilosicoli TaxID=52584 RepID=UPI002491FA3C|nr:hypothetical protein [Brachyspira pilosicoli]